MTVWKYSPGKGARFWDFCLENDLIAMGWVRTNDLSWIDSLDEMRKVCRKVRYSIDGPRTSEKQLWDFKSVAENDIIVAYGKGKILGIGMVISPYFYDNSRQRAVYLSKEEIRYPHRYKVNWVNQKGLDISNDPILYGDPPNRYGTLTTEDTIHRIEDANTIKVVKQLALNVLF